MLLSMRRRFYFDKAYALFADTAAATPPMLLPPRYFTAAATLPRYFDATRRPPLRQR